MSGTPTTVLRTPLNETFDSLFVREYPAMVALAAAVSGNAADAEDIAQDAMGRLLKDWERVRALDKPGAWLRRITINLSISRRRRLRSEARAILRLGRQPEGRLEYDAVDEALWQHVRSLPKQQRAVLALHFLEDRTLTDIANILDISPATARVHLHRARQTIQAKLENEKEER